MLKIRGCLASFYNTTTTHRISKIGNKQHKIKA
jgi:hypothetical protein